MNIMRSFLLFLCKGQESDDVLEFSSQICEIFEDFSKHKATHEKLTHVF